MAESALLLTNPVPGGTTSGQFGDWYVDGQGRPYLHRGWDIAPPPGHPQAAIIAPCDLTIARFTNDGSFGWKAICGLSDSGLYILLAHCSASYVIIGQRVRRGETIGLVGNEGTGSGYHTHVQVCDDSRFSTDIRFSHDPESYLVNEEEEMSQQDLTRLARLEEIVAANAVTAVCYPGMEDLIGVTDSGGEVIGFPAGTPVAQLLPDGWSAVPGTKTYRLKGEPALEFCKRRGFSFALGLRNTQVALQEHVNQHGGN